ncbi:MAG: hypothetical protein AAGA78_00025 [Pseudomonadota bacterium]
MLFATVVLYLMVLGMAGVLLACAPGRLALWLTRVGWALVALALIGALATAGLYYTHDTYMGDLWVALNALKRVQDGAVAHLDFASPIGPLYYWIHGLTVHISDLNLRAVILSNGVFALIVLGLGWAMLRARISPVGMALALALAVTTTLSVREIDGLFAQLSSSALAPYNRWAWGLMIPVTLRLCAPVPEDRTDPLGVLALSLGLAGLLLLKVTYGAAALAVLVAGLAIRPRGWIEGLAALALMVLWLVLAQMLSGQLLAYRADLSTAAGLQSDLINRLWKGIRLGPEAGVFALGALGVLALARPSPGASAWVWARTHWRAALMSLGCVLAGWLVLVQNHPQSEAPLYAAAALVAWEWGRTRDGGQIAPLVLTALIVLRAPLVDGAMGLAQLADTRTQPTVEAFAGTAFGDLAIPAKVLRRTPQGACVTPTCADIARMQSGRELLDAHPAPPGAILALNFSNPFPALTGTLGPRHAPIWFHRGRSFGPEAHPEPARLFSDVGRVLVAKNEPNAAVLREIYGPVLDRAFTKAGETADWVLYLRAP